MEPLPDFTYKFCIRICTNCLLGKMICAGGDLCHGMTKVVFGVLRRH